MESVFLLIRGLVIGEICRGKFHDDFDLQRLIISGMAVACWKSVICEFGVSGQHVLFGLGRGKSMGFTSLF
jgi:hypothetical protein